MAGNSFGTLFRFTSWGESHGPAIGCVVDGTPPRIPLSEADIQVWMEKRRPGQSRFVTQRQEPDTVRILSGVFEGVTTGTPIALHIDNVDQRSRDYSDIATAFRPGNGITNPTLIRQAEPVYTAEARAAKIQGVVELDACCMHGPTRRATRWPTSPCCGRSW
jgi:hypothetical protein